MGISITARRYGHRYTMSAWGATHYCPQCSYKASAIAGMPIQVNHCQYDKKEKDNG
jgi:hypothetical protein